MARMRADPRLEGAHTTGVSLRTASRDLRQLVERGYLISDGRAGHAAGQFPTRYFVLYLGCTLDFTSRSCPFGRHDGQGRDEHLFPRTNAAPGLAAGAGRNYSQGLRGPNEICCAVTRSSERRPSGASK